MPALPLAVRLLSIAVASGVAVSLGGQYAGPASSAPPKPYRENASGAFLGAVGGTIPTPPLEYRATESALDRQLAAIRMFALWDSSFPDATATWARAGGRRVLLSVKAQTAQGFVSYRTIAQARLGTPMYDAIVRWAVAIKRFHAPLYFTFNHEPEAKASDGSGNAADYISAWRRIVAVFRQLGVTNARYLFIATAHGFKRTDERRASRYYPGDAYVDDLGADAYNWYHCRAGIDNAWRSLRDIIEPFRQFGAQHPAKGLLVPEFASAEDPAAPGRKAQWVRDARALFQQPRYPRFAGILMFYRSTLREACDFRVTSSPAALQAYRAMASDPFYGGRP